MKSLVKMLKNSRGFSLVELMVVVAIISILATIAIPKFRTFQAKARQAEAKMNLSNIYTLEASYQAENDTFVNIAYGDACLATGNALGFYITDCTKARYGYRVTGSSVSAFTGEADSSQNTSNPGNNLIVPGCATKDNWTINQSKTLTNVTNSVTSCNP